MALHTLGDIRNSVMRICGMDNTDTDLITIVDGFINSSYADVLASFDWDWARVEGGVNLSPTTAAGTIVGTGTTITGVGTSFSSSNVGSYIQIQSLGKESHIISAVTSTGALTIREAMSSPVSDSAYLIFKPDYVLTQRLDPSTIKFVVDTNKSLRLEYQPEILLERYFVNEGSIATADTPRYWTIVGQDDNGYSKLRFFPIPDQNKYLKFVAMREAVELTTANDTPIIPLRHQEVIENGALQLVNAWHGRMDQAAMWKAEYDNSMKKMKRSNNTRASYSFPREPNDLPKPRIRKFILRLPGAFGGNILD